MKTIDYRNSGWGHAIYTYPAKDDSHDCTALAIHRTKVEVGDTVIWSTEYGHCELLVTESKWKGDPEDMYEVELVIVKRYGHDGEILWEKTPDAPA